MKTKSFKILVAIFIFATLALVLTACGPHEQSFDGMYIVTFEFNGGILNNGSTNIYRQIHHAYEPDSLVIDIAHFKNYQFTKSEQVLDEQGNPVKDDKGNDKYEYYDFVGWYTDSELTDEWNFQTDRVSVEKLTLYAKWKTRIKYTYDLYYTDEGGQEQRLGSYQVDAGRKFGDTSKFAENGLTAARKTFVGFYSDKELTTPWNADYTHPGGEQDTSIPVYVGWIDGVWALVSDFQSLQNAFGAMTAEHDGIWLTADIDCGGAEFYVDSFDKTLRGDNDDGANYKISNFVVEGQSISVRPRYSIFGTLGATASIHDVDFVSVSFVFDGMGLKTTPQIAALAQTVATSEEATTCTITNVNISGTYEYNRPIVPENLDLANMSTILAKFVAQQDATISITNSTSTFTAKAEV